MKMCDRGTLHETCYWMGVEKKNTENAKSLYEFIRNMESNNVPI